MNYLLDTHILIWAITEPTKLSKNIKDIIANPEYKILVSSISFWEISLKYSLGKMDLQNLTPEDFPIAAQSTGFSIMPLKSEDCATYHNLVGSHHKDPFDRMLIWMAINNNYTLISDDTLVKQYKAQGLKVIW